MDLDEAFMSRLLDDSAVTAIVGDRVHWDKRTQGDPLPAVVLQTISEDRPQHLKGFEDMATARVQASCFAARHSEAKLLARAVFEAVVAPAQVANVKFWRAGFGGARSGGEQEEGTGFVFQRDVDVMVRWSE